MHRIYTIGYEALDVCRFLATLKDAGIEVLADVRAVALSRKKGFSKTALRDELEASGIGYEHFIQLGNPKQGRLAAREGHSFVRVYRRHLNSPESQDALKALASLAKQNLTCLMCFERDPATCHRSMIAARLVAEGFATFHLFGEETTSHVGHREFLPGGRPGQSPAAAE
jgi:uncharacterized protein (DUF488 family)